MLSQLQFDPYYGYREGSDPNSFVNATGRLQGDRPHMFRAQAVFFKLPLNLQIATSIEFSSGRPYSRQTRTCDCAGPDPIFRYQSTVIMDRSLRYSPIQNIDLSIGRKILFGKQFHVAIDGEILNLLNSNQELEFATLVLLNPSDTFQPVSWVQPRRLQIQLGLQF